MIDELERVRAFRAEQDAPSVAAEAAARAALMAAIRDGRSYDPGPALGDGHSGDPGPAVGDGPSSDSGRALGDGHGSDSGRALGEGRRGDTGRARERPRRRRSRWSVRTRTAVAVGLAGAAIVIAGALGLPTATTPPSALAAALEQLARVAASQEWSGLPGPHQYQYTKSESLTESDTLGPGRRECVVLQTQRREIWIAPNGAGEIRQANVASHFSSAADRAVCALDRITNAASQNNRWANRFAPHGLSMPTSDWRALSTDPARLLVQLRRLDGGPRSAGEDFVHIGDFLRESDAPPAIRAALYRAAALIPGVRLLGIVRDHAGRAGLGVAFMRDGRPGAELIFDRRTAALLAEEYFARSGRLAAWTVYLESKVVDRLPPAPLAH